MDKPPFHNPCPIRTAVMSELNQSHRTQHFPAMCAALSLKADLYGATFSHATSFTTRNKVVGFKIMF